MNDILAYPRRLLLRLAESAHKERDSELTQTTLTTAGVLVCDNPPIDMALALEYIQSLIICCNHCYMMCDKGYVAELREKVVQELARHNMPLSNGDVSS